MQALIEAARFNSIRKELCDEGALVELMALVLQEDHSRALQGLVLLNACVQVTRGLMPGDGALQ